MTSSNTLIAPAPTTTGIATSNSRPCVLAQSLIESDCASTHGQAEAILRALCEGVESAPMMLDVPEPNAKATALAQLIGLAPVFETARMYRGQMPKVDLTQLYGVTTLELG